MKFFNLFFILLGLSSIHSVFAEYLRNGCDGCNDDKISCTAPSMQKNWKCNMKGNGSCIWLFSTEECIEYTPGQDICQYETKVEYCDIGRGCVYDWEKEVCTKTNSCDDKKSTVIIEELEDMIDQYEEEAHLHTTGIESLKAEIEFRNQDIESVEGTIIEIQQKLDEVNNFQLIEDTGSDDDVKYNENDGNTLPLRSSLQPAPQPISQPVVLSYDQPVVKLQNVVVAPKPFSQSPIDLPTDQPTTSMPPTSAPTNSPTNEPTNKPTDQPTSLPPTSAPTNSPTNEPTNKPTDQPTSLPPTSAPTNSPTNKPTGKPTDQPTSMPTNPSLDVLSVSRSYVIDPSYPNFLRPSKHVFDYSKSGVLITPSNFHETTDRTYESSREAEEDLKLNFGLEGEYNGFSGAASVSTENMSKSRKKYTRIDHIISSAMKQVTVNALYPHRHLKPDVKKYLLEESPANIVRNIGPFYAKSLKLGATFQMSVVGITTNEEQASRFKNEVSADYSSFMELSINQDTDASSSSIDSCTEYKTETSSRGGDSSIFLSKSKTVEQMLDEWKDSITDENQYPVDHKLQYIWKLLDHEEMNPQKAIEVKNYIQGQWKTQYDDVNSVEQQLQAAKDHHEKKVDGDVTIKQPSEEKGGYRDRSITKSACKFISGRDNKNDGKWNLDSLYCGDGSRCLKWGGNCYAGRINLPEGIKVKTYRDFRLKEGKTYIYGPTNGDKNYWNYHDRTCGYRFFLENGYTCDQNPTCTL